MIAIKAKIKDCEVCGCGKIVCRLVRLSRYYPLVSLCPDHKRMLLKMKESGFNKASIRDDGLSKRKRENFLQLYLIAISEKLRQ